MDIPKGITLTKEDSSVVLTRRLLIKEDFFTILFAAFFAAGSIAPAFIPDVGFIMGLPFVLMGLIFFYFIFARLINKSKIVIDEEKLTHTYTPIPWIGKKEILKSDVQRVYIKKIMRRQNGSIREDMTRYEVRFVNTNGNDKVLLKGIDCDEQAAFLTFNMEVLLGLRQIRVG